MAGAADTQEQRQHGQQQQQQQGQGQEVSDGGGRPPALDRVSIASAIVDQLPKLSRWAAQRRCHAGVSSKLPDLRGTSRTTCRAVPALFASIKSTSYAAAAVQL